MAQGMGAMSPARTVYFGQVHISSDHISHIRSSDPSIGGHCPNETMIVTGGRPAVFKVIYDGIPYLRQKWELQCSSCFILDELDDIPLPNNIIKSESAYIGGPKTQSYCQQQHGVITFSPGIAPVHGLQQNSYFFVSIGRWQLGLLFIIVLGDNTGVIYRQCTVSVQVFEIVSKDVQCDMPVCRSVGIHLSYVQQHLRGLYIFKVDFLGAYIAAEWMEMKNIGSNGALRQFQHPTPVIDKVLYAACRRAVEFFGTMFSRAHKEPVRSLEFPEGLDDIYQISFLPVQLVIIVLSKFVF